MLFYERRQTNDRSDQEYLIENVISSLNTESVLAAAVAKQVASCSTNAAATAEAAAIMLSAEKAQSAKLEENAKAANKLSAAAESNETDSKSELTKSNLARNKCDIAIKSDEENVDGKDSAMMGEMTATGSEVATSTAAGSLASDAGSAIKKGTIAVRTSLLSKELEEWIWQDNRHFLQDRNIFEHTYFR